MPRIPIAFANRDAILNYGFDTIIDVPSLAKFPKDHVLDAIDQSAAIIERNVAALSTTNSPPAVGGQSSGQMEYRHLQTGNHVTIKGSFSHGCKTNGQLISRYYKAGNKDKSA